MRKTIQELRLARGWKQVELARRTDIPRDRLSKLENKKKGVTGPELERLCAVLECSPDDLDVLLSRPSGGQARPAGEQLSRFRAAPRRIARPEWTSGVRLDSLRAALPTFMQRFEGKLDGWRGFLDEAPSEARDETILQLLELNLGCGTTQVSTDYLGFDHWPVCDAQGRAAGRLLRPALITDHWILVFQVWVVTPRRYRMDGLLLVLEPQPTFLNLEVDDRSHDPALDEERARAIGLYTVRIPGHELMRGPSLTERLRALGFCLPVSSRARMCHP